MDKKAQRKEMHEARHRSHAASEHGKVQAEMLARIRAIPGWKEARVVLSYVSVRTEVPTNFINREIMKEGKTLCLPMTRLEEGVMEAGVARDLDGLRESKFGTLEPDPKDAEVLEPGKIDLVLVPGLAFDEKGHRLGYGSGYYDRYLKWVRTDCIKVGLAYEEQMLKQIVPEGHDVPVEFVVTQKRVLEIRK